MAIKKSYNGLPWQKWEQKHKDYNLAVLNADEFKNDVNFYIFEQFIFAMQYSEVKKYANEKVCKNKRNEEAAICYAYEKEAVIELLREQWYYIYKNVIKYSQAAFSV